MKISANILLVILIAASSLAMVPANQNSGNDSSLKNTAGKNSNDYQKDSCTQPQQKKDNDQSQKQQPKSKK